MRILDTYLAAKYIADSSKKPVVLLAGIDIDLAKQINIVAYTLNWLSDDEKGEVIFIMCDSKEEADNIMTDARNLLLEDNNYFDGYQFDNDGYCLDSLQ